MSEREAMMLRLDAAIVRLEQAIREPAMSEYMLERALADLRECRKNFVVQEGGEDA